MSWRPRVGLQLQSLGPWSSLYTGQFVGLQPLNLHSAVCVNVRSKANAVLPYTEPNVRSISCPWRYKPTISCEPGTAKVYLKKMKRKKKKKLDKTKHWEIKTVFEGLWIYSASGIYRQNENKNKMEHMGIEPGSRDSQANALTVTPRHPHLVFTSFYCI